ncbi:MAG: GUN4 domain-containing protein, partial [Cyanobacteria bacterium P01_H01_bin.15]
LWRLYSRDKFGFSIQRKLWLSLGQNYPKLWDKIGWRTSTDEFVRFPGGFTWELSAPVGHLPLSNQLRGVRVISAIFAHPAWQP